jgi:hypothetical protein
MITSAGNAKEKWCPFDKGQMSPREHNAGMCIGPDCMMWRYWIPPPEINNMEKTKHGIRDLDKKGYCGLAGSY